MLSILAILILESVISFFAIWPIWVDELGFAQAFERASDIHWTTSEAKGVVALSVYIGCG